MQEFLGHAAILKPDQGEMLTSGLRIAVEAMYRLGWGCRRIVSRDRIAKLAQIIRRYKMREKVLQYKFWIMLVLPPTLISLGAYTLRFHESEWSRETANWAHFSTYISGTVGVAIVFATLAALIKTLNQQSELIEQQDNMILLQKKQSNLQDKHQTKIEAYSRVEKILPKIINARNMETHSIVFDVMKEKYPAYTTQYFPRKMPLHDFFCEGSITYPRSIGKDLFFDYFWKEYLHKIYNLAEFTANCIEDAKDLEPHIRDQTRDFDVAMACALAYAKSSESYGDAATIISKKLNFPCNYQGQNIPAGLWERIGQAQHSREEKSAAR
ncbi:hypothetical protein ACUN9Y_07635 [Halomonas sp. V046]|uniref:hypothetical protein n=1 Tax=Halomonas sp. V046 TaxID=3459611 RepID=UPI004043D85E